jgi:hypothetical protein
VEFTVNFTRIIDPAGQLSVPLPPFPSLGQAIAVSIAAAMSVNDALVSKMNMTGEQGDQEQQFVVDTRSRQASLLSTNIK